MATYGELMSILDAVARGADLKHFNEKKHIKNNFDARKADQALKACPVCKAGWEIMVFNKTIDYKYYHNFPRYGKEKAVCPSCTIRIKNKYYHNAEVQEPA